MLFPNLDFSLNLITTFRTDTCFFDSKLDASKESSFDQAILPFSSTQNDQIRDRIPAKRLTLNEKKEIADMVLSNLHPGEVSLSKDLSARIAIQFKTTDRTIYRIWR